MTRRGFEKITIKEPERTENSLTPEDAEEKVEKLTEYFFNDFGNRLAAIFTGSSMPKEMRFKFKDTIEKSLKWIEKKYEKVPSQTEDPDIQPLIETKDNIKKLKEKVNCLFSEESEAKDVSEDIEDIVEKISEAGKKYTKTLNDCYLKLKGKNISEESIETRALWGFKNKEDFFRHWSWLKEQNINPNEFEKAAMQHWEKEEAN